jgi:hypothetical protein
MSPAYLAGDAMDAARLVRAPARAADLLLPGVVVRMAVLYEVLVGARDERTAPRPTQPQLA